MSAALRRRLLSRREWLEGALATALLPWLSTLGCGDDTGSGDTSGDTDGGALTPGFDASVPAAAEASIEELFSDAERAAIVAIGEARLSELGEDGASLEQTLAAIDGLDPGALGDAIQDDFEHGRVVRVAGWVLSRTEADLCALYALL